MRFSRNALTFSLLFTLLLGIFLLPQFSFNIGDQTLRWPALDFSRFDIDSPFGNFRRGTDIYDSIVVTADAALTDSQIPVATEIWNSDLELINDRMQHSGLSDVDLVAEEANGQRRLSFHFPQYYSKTNLNRLVSFLLSPGTFQILEHNNEATEADTVNPVLDEYFPGYVSRTSQIRPQDIESISIFNDARFRGTLLKIQFSQNAANDITDAMTRIDTSGGTVRPPVLAIDGMPQFALLDFGEDLQLLASSFDPSTDLTQLRVIANFAAQEIGTRVTYSNLVTSEQQPIYASEGRPLLAVTFIVGFVFLALWSLRKFELTGAITFAVALGTYLIYGLALLKLTGMTISIGMLTGFVVMYILGAVAVYDLMSSGRAKLEQRMQLYRDLAALMFFAAALVFSGGLAFGVFAEVIVTVAFMAMALFVSALFGFKQVLLNFYVNRN